MISRTPPRFARRQSAILSFPIIFRSPAALVSLARCLILTQALALSLYMSALVSYLPPFLRQLQSFAKSSGRRFRRPSLRKSSFLPSGRRRINSQTRFALRAGEVASRARVSVWLAALARRSPPPARLQSFVRLSFFLVFFLASIPARYTGGGNWFFPEIFQKKNSKKFTYFLAARATNFGQNSARKTHSNPRTSPIQSTQKRPFISGRFT